MLYLYRKMSLEYKRFIYPTLFLVDSSGGGPSANWIAGTSD